MSRILVTVMPFAGHVAPVGAVVSELIARGHDVVVYTGSRYTSRFEKLGARSIPWIHAPDFDEHDLQATFPEVGRRGPRGLIANVEFVFIRSGVGQVHDILAEYERQPFDLIVGDIMSIGAGLSAELFGIPWATISVVPLALPSEDLPPMGLALHPGVGPFGRLRDATLRAAFSAASRPLDRAYREVRGSVGLPEAANGFDTALYSPWLVAVTGSPSIEYPRSDLAPHFHFVGRLTAVAGAGFSLPGCWADVEARKGQLVLVTQGTFNIDPADLIEPALAGLAETDALVLATTAGAELQGATPANARTADFLPFAQVLPTVDVAITNGGWGGVLEALAHGVPLIVAGGDLDKPEIAARVAWSGAGVDLRTGHPKPAAVKKAYLRVTGEPSFRERARAIANELAALGGASAAVDLIETLVRTGKPVRRA